VIQLQDEILKPSLFPAGRTTWEFNSAEFPFVEVVSEILIDAGILRSSVALSESHLYISAEHRRPDPRTHDSMPTTLVSEAFRDDKSARALYQKFIKKLSQEVLGFDVLFQAVPTFRFHFPARILPDMRGPGGELLAYHFDQCFGDPFRQINCWLPLTPCFGTNAMLVAGHEDSINILYDFCWRLKFDRELLWCSRKQMFEYLFEDSFFRTRTVASCSPLETEFGCLHVFDGRFLHGTAENVERATRVSADFRLLAVEDYECGVRSGIISLDAEQNDQSDRYVRGGFYDAKSAFEV